MDLSQFSYDSKYIRGNYSFLEGGLQQLFKGGNYLLLGGFDHKNYSIEDENCMKKLEYWSQLNYCIHKIVVIILGKERWWTKVRVAKVKKDKKINESMVAKAILLSYRVA